MATSLISSIFEERAENLDQEELTKWTTETPRHMAILKKLKGPGLKLLSGPRGSGKSTLLRKAYYALLADDVVVPAYINFSKSLALEPLFLTRANALQIFRQWVLYKIVLGLAEGAETAKRSLPQSLQSLVVAGGAFIHDLETSQSAGMPSHLISPSELLKLISGWLQDFQADRCVLLLDDAAHAFSSEQQREFFEIFGSLRSREVSAKAAVYPGITSYSPIFHIGHEAESLEVWHSPDDDTYLETMRKVAQNRLSEDMYKLFEERFELIDYLALASFGLPRGFLNMLSFVLGIEDDKKLARPTRARADSAVRTHADTVVQIFSSLRGKLPRYKRFVDVGLEIEQEISQALRRYNLNKPPGKLKASTIGIAQPLSNELQRILAMAEYAGMLRRESDVSKGDKGVYQRYTLHFALILKENSLALGKAASTRAAIDSLSKASSHSFTRLKESALVGASLESRCTINLAPCTKCGTPRVSDEAKFCMKCGMALTSASIYEALVGTPIETLPLTTKKIKGLREHTDIKTVQDILTDVEFKQILNVPRVGPVWAARIRNAAEEYVSV